MWEVMKATPSLRIKYVSGVVHCANLLHRSVECDLMMVNFARDVLHFAAIVLYGDA